MDKKNDKKFDKIFLIVIISVVIITAYYYLPSNYGFLFDNFIQPNWEEIQPKYIIKNSIPITLVESMGRNCNVSAKNLDKIFDHVYFKRSAELEAELNFDRETKTITVSCDSLYGEKSKLSIWYVVEESPSHAKKYQYFITSINEDIQN